MNQATAFSPCTVCQRRHPYGTAHQQVTLNPKLFPPRGKVYFHVRPRYTPGSPAMVPEDTALRVAHEEREAWKEALDGSWGEEAKKRAETLGLDGIAYAMMEKGSGRNFRWHVQDLCTGQLTRRHHEHEIYRQGFTCFAFLPQTVQKRLNKTEKDSDYDRTYWKYENSVWVEYVPEIVRPEF